MPRALTHAVLVIGPLMLGGCAIPFAQSAKYDPTVVSAPGTITVSDPKLYSREALINERSREVARIQKLIDGIDAVQFKPDIVREIEQISAISAALGIKIDPAAGLSFRRSQEISDLQQDISVLQMQLQLEQLRRDAQLFRDKLPEQTEPLNKDLGKITATGPAAAASNVTAPLVDQLIARIDGLLAALRTQLATEGKPTAPTSVTANPFDDFRDRQAYQDMLRSARNAAALDELHDQGNAALIRLNFQATVIPDTAYRRSLGVVQVKVDTGTFDDEVKTQFLSEWLDHINLKRDRRTAAGDSDAHDLQRMGMLSIVSVNGYEIAFPAAAPVGTVRGLVTDFKEADWPRSSDFSRSKGLMSSFSFDPGPTTAVFAALCQPSLSASVEPRWQNSLSVLLEDTHLARTRVLTFEYVRKVDPWLFALGATSNYAPNAETEYQRAVAFLKDLRESVRGVPGCDPFAKSLPEQAPPLAWGKLMPRLGKAAEFGKARVYEVGPREQVQQMSTVARSANSLALAASIAAAAPSSGVAADAALGYSRQAMGRATALERVPSVVGYTVGGKQTFGWVLGPRSLLDPKGSIDVEQILKPYDLSVDMSVPAWWPKVRLKVSTLWGPSPRQLVAGMLAGSKETDIEIPMPRRAPDFDWFTQELTGSSGRAVTIEEVTGGPVNACSATTLLVSGRNVWRADKVLVLGQLLEGSAITIAPDMRGILLSVPAIPPLAGNQVREPSLHVITPFGRHKYDSLAYLPTPSGDDCKPKKTEVAVDPSKISITKISPDLHFTVPAAFDINVQGKNLDKVMRVTLHGQPGSLKLSGTGRLTVSFTLLGTQSIPASDAAKLEFFSNNGKSEEVADTRLVRITR